MFGKHPVLFCLTFTGGTEPSGVGVSGRSRLGGLFPQFCAAVGTMLVSLD